MAHEITIREDGKAEMAFVGSRKEIWHGLGSELQPGASIDTWKEAAGLDWEVMPSSVQYQALVGANVETLTYPKRKILFRSDNQKPLSVVSTDYKVVQPTEVLEFFNDVALQNQMSLSTAGSLFGGKRFWALAETNKKSEVVKNDTIKGFLLLTTSVDGTLATTAKFTSTRVVCNNTLTVAMSEKATGNMFKKSHRSVWDAKEAKLDLGLIDEVWDGFIGNLKKLAEVEMNNDEARVFFESQFYDPAYSAEEQSRAAQKHVSSLMELFMHGTGSEYSGNTAWGALNAVTEGYTHGSGNRNASHQFWNSYYGNGDKFKTKVMNDLLTTAGAL